MCAVYRRATTSLLYFRNVISENGRTQVTRRACAIKCGRSVDLERVSYTHSFAVKIWLQKIVLAACVQQTDGPCIHEYTTVGRQGHDHIIIIIIDISKVT